MIHVVTLANQHLYPHQLDQMFRMRGAPSTDEFGWVGRDPKSEAYTDEFDDDEAVYLIGIDRFGLVSAACRANPSTGANILAQKFPDALDVSAARRSDIWHLSRWRAADPYGASKSADATWKLQMELACATMEFAVSRGITAFTTIAATSRLSRLDEHGWTYKRLGPPITEEKGAAEFVAISIDAGVHALMAARAAGQIFHDVSFEVAAEPDRLNGQAIRDAMRRAGRRQTQDAVLALTQEIVRLADLDPAGSIAVIKGFQETLTERLTELASTDRRLTG